MTQNPHATVYKTITSDHGTKLNQEMNPLPFPGKETFLL
jgi:hypothetical protein